MWETGGRGESGLGGALGEDAPFRDRGRVGDGTVLETPRRPASASAKKVATSDARERPSRYGAEDERRHGRRGNEGLERKGPQGARPASGGWGVLPRGRLAAWPQGRAVRNHGGIGARARRSTSGEPKRVWRGGVSVSRRGVWRGGAREPKTTLADLDEGPSDVKSVVRGRTRSGGGSAPDQRTVTRGRAVTRFAPLAFGHRQEKTSR